MDRERLAAGLGLAAAALVLLLTALPYAFAQPEAIGTYYGVGLAGPAFVSLLSVAAAVTLLSAATRRSDPALASGVAVTVGAFAVVLSLLWALPAGEVVSGIPVPAWFELHPASIVAATLALAGASGWYARSVL